LDLSNKVLAMLWKKIILDMVLGIVLSTENEEGSINHLLIHCPFFQYVGVEALSLTSVVGVCQENLVEGFIKLWFENGGLKEDRDLPFVVSLTL
jgi:hypothetical protein